mgnify:CR=1 FL=1
MSDKEIKHLSLRVEKDLHMKLKFKLLEDDISFQQWCINQIKEYVGEDQD